MRRSEVVAEIRAMAQRQAELVAAGKAGKPRTTVEEVYGPKPNPEGSVYGRGFVCALPEDSPEERARLAAHDDHDEPVEGCRYCDMDRCEVRTYSR